MKHIIIGGVAGGATAAARIRRVDETAGIILFEKGQYISYANCGLPYYIGGVIEERENLFVQTPESFGNRFRVDVRTESEVIHIDREKKEVVVRKATGEEYTESYDKLLLSPGATPVRPPLPGIDSEGIFTLRNVADTDRIKSYLATHTIKKAVVIGGGFIGLEMAENLYHGGAEVSVVEMGNQVMAPIDFSMASLIHQYLAQKGIHLYLEQTVTSFVRKENGIEVAFKSGDTIDAELVILSIGVRPETTLAKHAGLTIGVAGGIWVDAELRTSDPDIYAVGDAIEFPHPLTGKPWLNYLAGPANRQARICADNMAAGTSGKYEGSVGTAIAKVFALTVASTGLPAKRLRQEGIPYLSSVTHGNSHAGYYPGAMPLTLKITFDPVSGQLFGAQIVGGEGVDKRIDELAMVVKNRGTIYDLMRLEHAYAPPFSSAKDPVAIAGYVAENILLKRMDIIHWQEMRDAVRSEITILDVRTRDEFALGGIDGAVNIPLDEIRGRLQELPAGKPVYVYCAVGLRGYLAARILKHHGFQAYNLSGGYKTYLAATTPLCWKNEKCEKTDTPVIEKTIKIDACGLQCPGPVLRLKKSMDGLNEGEQIEISATDPGFARDAQAWCNTTGNRLLSQTEQQGKYIVVIEKQTVEGCPSLQPSAGKAKTLILFSDDLDKALATFVLANGAAASGGKVTIFFTFWGLNVIKKVQKPKVPKDIFGRMFGMMLPSSSKVLKLSKMNMFGIGGKMMRHIMKLRGIDSLESLREQAIENGVEFIACQMSMDVMGVCREELLDEVTIGGVATYMERAEKANVNLFI